MTRVMIRLAMFAAVASMVLLTGVPLYASAADDGIEAAARQSYVFKRYLKDDSVQVQSTNGDVVLTGTVADDASRSLAQETVISLPGVRSVDNRLTIAGAPPAAYSDAWLITKVKSTLLFHRNVSGSMTEVLAKDGVVTLRGEAGSTAQRELATEYAKDVDGVKSVRNEMTVPGAPMKSGKTTMGQKLDAMGESIDDASVTALVKMTLLYHRSTSALHTTVSTTNGVVTLGGKAKNDAEKALAAMHADDVHGVRQVINNITVTGAY